MKYFLIISFVFGTSLLFHAQTCDTLIWPASKYQKDYQKYNNKVSAGREIKFKRIDIILGVADYLRLKGDSASKKWYQCAQVMFRERFYFKKDELEVKAGILYKAGRCYFYLEKYREASVLLSEAIAAKCSDPCAAHYLLLSNGRIGTGK